MKHIYMIGDSTMRYNNFLRYPQTGWGQTLELFVQENITIKDYAENGRSTKSFLDEGRFDIIYESLKPGDYVICQFGHNDEKDDAKRYTAPFTTYVKNLEYYANKTKEKDANIVFATPITRHKFENGVCVNTHGEYPRAMLEFCKKNGYTCIDLNHLTMAHYTTIGEEESKKYHMIFPENTYKNYPIAKDDHSHLVYEGALMVCELFVRALAKTDSPFKDWFINLNEKEYIDEKMLID